MKKLFILCAVALTFSAVSCNTFNKTTEPEPAADSTAVRGSIVYFNIDKVMDGYDLANDLRSVVETKVNGIQAEIDRRGNKLQKDFNEFQNKIDKGLLTRTVAEAQSQKLQQQQADYQQYALRKQNEMAEEQQVMLNQIMDAINTYVQAYNEEKGYEFILTTSGSILSAPIVAANPALDITEEILAGLNAEYVKTKAEK